MCLFSWITNSMFYSIFEKKLSIKIGMGVWIKLVSKTAFVVKNMNLLNDIYVWSVSV